MILKNDNQKNNWYVSFADALHDCQDIALSHD